MSKFRKLFKCISLLVLTFFVMSSIAADAHSGRTDRYGGHYNRKTGEYHYHNRGYSYNKGLNPKPQTLRIKRQRKNKSYNIY